MQPHRPADRRCDILNPEQGVADQELAHFVAGVIEYQRTPIRMFSLPRVGVFIEVSAVKKAESVLILGEMGRHPVENDTNTCLMAGIDELHKLVGRAETTGSSKIVGDPIAPRAIKRVFSHRQQFDMGVTHSNKIRNKSVDHVFVADPVIVFRTLPGTEVDFVNIDRRADVLFCCRC